MEKSKSIVYSISTEKLKTMVEIFKTNAKNKRLANNILKVLGSHFPSCYFNFDLDDCDRILRVQSECSLIECGRIIQIVTQHSVEVCLFED